MVRFFFLLITLAGITALSYFILPEKMGLTYQSSIIAEVHDTILPDINIDSDTKLITTPIPFIATHIQTPAVVKGIYMSSWVAGAPTIRAKLVSLIDTTELNTVVIDVKDATGRVAFLTTDPTLSATGSPENRIPDINAFIANLHKKNIYVVGRIAVFQDPYMTKLKPDWAIKKKSDGTTWKDFKGLSFLDPSKKEVWDYTISIAKESYKHGFDEINFDYIRFPSDGKISDIAYPNTDGTVTRADIMKSFFQYQDEQLKDTGIVRSADLFGLVTVSPDDLGIGQVLENALPYFDYVDPMVYPSHFAAGWNNFKNPADHPYDVVKYTMDQAILRTKAIGLDQNKIRPWLQDFDLGAIYTAPMVQSQIKATYDSGLTSWLIWDASNTYTPGAFQNTAIE